MSQLMPHLLLRTNGASHASALLLGAGYMVSKIDDDAIAEEIAGASHVDGVVVELTELAAIAFTRRIEARYGRNALMLLVISPSPDTVRRALPVTLVMGPAALDDDLISTIDLAFVAHQLRRTG